MAKNIKFIIVLFFFGLIGFNAQAQETETKIDTVFGKIKSFNFTDVKSFGDGFRFGIHLSPTFGSFDAIDSLDAEGARSGWSYGIILDKYLGKQKRYAFSTGLSIVNKGGTLQTLGDVAFPKALEDFEDLDGGTLDFGSEVDLNLRYWEIPLILRLRTNPIKEKFVGYGHFGWAAGFRGKARGEVAGVKDVKFNKEIRGFNFSLSYGFGVEYQLSEESTAMVGLSFNRGLINAIKNTDKATADHVALQIGIFF